MIKKAYTGDSIFSLISILDTISSAKTRRTNVYARCDFDCMLLKWVVSLFAVGYLWLSSGYNICLTNLSPSLPGYQTVHSAPYTARILNQCSGEWHSKFVVFWCVLGQIYRMCPLLPLVTPIHFIPNLNVEKLGLSGWQCNFHKQFTNLATGCLLYYIFSQVYPGYSSPFITSYLPRPLQVPWTYQGKCWKGKTWILYQTS